MSVAEHARVYDELIDLLAETAEAERLLAFRLSSEKQARLDLLLQKNREEILSEEESSELDDFERLTERTVLIESHRFPPASFASL